MATKKYFVLRVIGGVEPEVVGPFKTIKARDTKARTLSNRDAEDGVFWMNVTNDGKVTVGSYSGGYMEGIRGFNGSEG